MKRILLITMLGTFLLFGANAFAQDKSVCGDVSDDGVINISDLVYMIDWLFITGPPPADPTSAEMDLCNGIDIGDVDYLTNYMFRGGPAPCAGTANCTPQPGASVSLDHVDGELSPGVLSTGVPITFYLRLTNNTGTSISGATHAMRVYSPDGAYWGWTSVDTVTNPGFDLTMRQEIHGPMSGYDDTVSFMALAVSEGMLDGYDDVVYKISISSLDASLVGKTICLDSTSFGSAGKMKWTHDGQTHYIPSWPGPVCFSIAEPPLGEASISLDNVDGYSVDDNGILAETPITFNIRMTNLTSLALTGFTNGFRIYSPDGATWQSAVGDTVALGWWDRFNLVFSMNHFSCDGFGSDTVGFGGVATTGPGLEDGFDAVSLLIRTQVSGDMEGKTLCVDSAYFPQSGYWLWAVASGETVYPQWDGPHCYNILAAPLGGIDSLIIPSTTVTYGDMVQPIHVKLSQPIKGASIPLKIPLDAEVDSLSRVGLLTEDWDYTFSYVKPDSGFLYIALANSHGDIIPAGEHALVNIHFHALNADCDVPFYISWDTTMSDDPVRGLLFADIDGQDVLAAFDRGRDQTEVPPYVPGDMNISGEVDIADLVYMVAYMFLGGPPPYIMNTMDVNGSCTGPNISDLVYFVDFFYRGGSPLLCGCLGEGAGKVAINEAITVGAIFENGVTSIVLESPQVLRGLEIELTGEASGEPVNLMADRMDLVHGFVDNRLQIGLLDLDGGEIIGAGVRTVVEIPGEWEIGSAMVAVDGREAFGVRIDNAMKSVTTPKTYELVQNYPNPFNPKTQISFSLPVAGFVQLHVYNVMGQQVAELVNRHLAAGVYTETFDGRNTASGVYFYKLETSGFSETKKMVLLK